MHCFLAFSCYIQGESSFRKASRNQTETGGNSELTIPTSTPSSSQADFKTCINTLKPGVMVSAHPQRCSQGLVIGMGMKLQKAVGLGEGGALPEVSEPQLSKYLFPCRKRSHQINLFVTLMQKGRENGIQEIQTHSLEVGWIYWVEAFTLNLQERWAPISVLFHLIF